MAFKAGIWGEARRRGLAPHDILSWWPRRWLRLQQETGVGGPGAQEHTQGLSTFTKLSGVCALCLWSASG